VERCVERSVAAAAAPGDRPIERQRLLALPQVHRRRQAQVVGPEQPHRVSEAVRRLLTREMTVAEPLGRAMAPAQQATQGLAPAGLHARHEMTQVALHATLEAAAVHATLEAIGAAVEPAAVGPESHRQREVRTA
jgi:hypothetical protein